MYVCWCPQADCTVQRTPINSTQSRVKCDRPWLRPAQVEEQIGRLAEPVLNPASAQLITPSVTGRTRSESLAKVERLLKRFERYELCQSLSNDVHHCHQRRILEVCDRLLGLMTASVSVVQGTE